MGPLLLSVIRTVPAENLFPKNKPDYAPEFITSIRDDEHEHIICSDYSVLLWLANQLALEFHIPFQTADTAHPTEIVFDLDPPSKSEFPLAVRAAKELHRLFDQLGLSSFPKLSGNKGIQIYIPISKTPLLMKKPAFSQALRLLIASRFFLICLQQNA
ncbi:hypothetical protein AAGG52_08830 [Bacillus licheniformis]